MIGPPGTGIRKLCDRVTRQCLSPLTTSFHVSTAVGRDSTTATVVPARAGACLEMSRFRAFSTCRTAGRPGAWLEVARLYDLEPTGMAGPTRKRMSRNV